MFGKLLKNEFRATGRVIPFVFLAMLGLLALHAIVNLAGNAEVSQLTQAISVVALIVQGVVVTALIIWRFYRSVCADEGYLTNMLPVRPSSLLLSKLLAGGFWSLVSSLMTVTSIMFLAAEELPGKDAPLVARISVVGQVILGTTGFDDQIGWFLVVILLMQVITTLISLEMIYYAILLGSSPIFRKTGILGIVLCGLAEYMLIQGISLAAIALIPLSLHFTLANDKISSIALLFERTDTNYLRMLITQGPESLTGSVPLSVGVGSWIILPFLIPILFFLITSHLKKKTNLR